jgi:hypothetical protein
VVELLYLSGSAVDVWSKPETDCYSLETPTMDKLTVTGHVNEQHVLLAQVPTSVPPGPVTIVIVPTGPQEDAEAAWMTGIARDWAEELADTRQDIYSLEDGEPVDGAT